MWCQIFGCPFTAEMIKKYLERAVKAEAEAARLREIMVQEGLNQGGSIYVTGQQRKENKNEKVTY